MVPVLEILIGMPDAGPTRGSDEWIELMRQNMLLATFEDMVEYPQLLRAYVKEESRNVDEDGFVPLRPDEIVTCNAYDPTEVKTKSVLRETRRLMEVCNPNPTTSARTSTTSARTSTRTSITSARTSTTSARIFITSARICITSAHFLHIHIHCRTPSVFLSYERALSSMPLRTCETKAYCR